MKHAFDLSFFLRWFFVSMALEAATLSLHAEEPPHTIPYTASGPNVADSRQAPGALYVSCKQSINSKYFYSSYCADVIWNAAYASSMISAAAVSETQPCGKELLKTVKQLSWFNYLAYFISMRDVAKQYLCYVDDHRSSVSDLNNLLTGTDELMMASAIIAVYKKAPLPKTPINWQKGAWNVRPLGKDSASLYESCESVEHSNGIAAFRGSYCNAMITGLWIGYSLAQYDPPRITPGNKCEKEQRQLLSDFQRRYRNGLACYAPHRKNNEDVAQRYLTIVRHMSPEQAMHLQEADPPSGMMGAIHDSCE